MWFFQDKEEEWITTHSSDIGSSPQDTMTFVFILLFTCGNSVWNGDTTMCNLKEEMQNTIMSYRSLELSDDDISVKVSRDAAQ